MIRGGVVIICGAVLVVLGTGLAVSAVAQQAPPSPARDAPTSATPATPPATSLPLEPQALEILKASSRRLAEARTLSFTAAVSYESPSRLGAPLIYTTRSVVTLQRPDKLRVIQTADGPASEFYYDGKTMMAFSPAENLVAVAEAPATIDAALEAAYHQAAIYFPFTDVIVADPYAAIAQGLELAFYIGQSNVIGGITTDMVAYASHGVFVQIWIGAKDKLPRMARAVFAKDPLRLRHQAEFSNWKLGDSVATDAFTSARAASAKRIPFAHPDPPPSAEAPASSPADTSKTK
jgi:hypothetical protein